MINDEVLTRIANPPTPKYRDLNVVSNSLELETYMRFGQKWMAEMAQELLQARQRIMDLEEQVDVFEDGLNKIKNWSIAYPLDIFPEPDLKKARELLKTGGIPLDEVTAHAMRHVVDGVGRIAREALDRREVKGMVNDDNIT